MNLNHQPTTPPVLSRVAVSVFFFIAGFTHANWVSRIPEIQEFWQVSNSLLGTILLCSAGGAVLAMPFAGVLIVKFGSRLLSIFTMLTLCALVVFIPIFKSLWLIIPLFFLMGVFGGSMDIAINGQAVYVERAYNKPIMSSFHALFSLGTVLGAGSGALFAKFEMPLVAHFGICVSICFALIMWAMFHLVKDESDKIVENMVQTHHQAASMTEGVAQNKQEGGALQLPTKAILPLGIIAFCGMSGEGAIADWSALYMNKIIGMDVSFSALAFGAFTLAMTTGRFLGDFVIAEYGQRKTLIFNSLAAILGLVIVLIFNNPYLVLLGFFITGLGVATIVPVVYSAAGNTEGVPPSVGIAMATTVGYAGFFVAPPVIGYLADAFSLRVGLLFTLALFGVMLLFVGRFVKK
jgi:MFS family permease